MKVNKNREQLEFELSKILKEFVADRDFTNNIKEEMMQHGISPGLTQGLINESRSLETQPMVILCILTSKVHRITENERINPENWFTDIEIKEAKRYKRDITNNKFEYIEIDNIIQVAEDQWITVMTYKQIYDIWMDGRARYNKETQRNTVIKEYGDKIIEKINTNKSAIKSITKRMTENTFISNTLTFNILADGTEDFEYDEKNNKMIINSIVDAIDGFHRMLGVLEVVSSNMNLDKNMEVRITNFNVDKCHQFMLQEDIRNPLDRKFKQSISSSLENIIVKRLNEDSNSELRGKIATNKLLYNRGNAYVMFDTLANTIKSEFTIKNQRDVNNLTKYLIEGYNEIIGIFFDDFKNSVTSRQNNVKSHSNIFIGYTALLAKLMNNSDWKMSLENILRGINFNFDNPAWEELNINSININKTQINQVRKYFRKEA